MQIYINTDSITDKTLAAHLLASSFANTEIAGTPETETHYSTGIWVNGSTFTADTDFLPAPDDEATNGEDNVSQYTLPEIEVFILSTPYEHGLILADKGTTIKTIVASFETGDFDQAQHLASWGFDGTPDEAPDGTENVRVWIEPCYYAGTLGAPIGHYARDEHHEPIIFTTTSEAQEWIDEQEQGVYSLGNGEAGRPTYTICE